MPELGKTSIFVETPTWERLLFSGDSHFAGWSACKRTLADLGGFRIPGVEGLSTCGRLKGRAAGPEERLQTPTLEAWRLGCPDVSMPRADLSSISI